MNQIISVKTAFRIRRRFTISRRLEKSPFFDVHATRRMIPVYELLSSLLFMIIGDGLWLHDIYACLNPDRDDLDF